MLDWTYSNCFRGFFLGLISIGGRSLSSLNSDFMTGMLLSPGSSGPGEEVADIVVEPLDDGPWSFDCWFVSKWSDGGDGEALRLTDADDSIGVKFLAAFAGDLKKKNPNRKQHIDLKQAMTLVWNTYASLSRFLNILGLGEDVSFDAEVKLLSLIIKVELSLVNVGCTVTDGSTIMTGLNLMGWEVVIKPKNSKITSLK